MHIQDHIIVEMEKGNTPAIRFDRIQGDDVYVINRNSIMLEFRSYFWNGDDVFQDWYYDYTTVLIIGNTYKVQHISKRAGMGLSFKVTSIEDKGYHALIHYEIVGE